MTFVDKYFVTQVLMIVLVYTINPIRNTIGHRGQVSDITLKNENISRLPSQRWQEGQVIDVRWLME